MTPVLILTTLGADHDARAIAHALVEARLPACVNIVPRVESVYRWDDKVETDAEQLLIIKTFDYRVEELREELFRLHPYDVPEFVMMRIAATSEAYGEWLLQSTQNATDEG